MRMFGIFALSLLSSLLVGCAEAPQESYGEVSVRLCHLTDCDEAFIDLISGASSLACAFYDLDNKQMEMLLEEKGAKVVIDEHQARSTPFPVREGEGLMHNKFCVIDRSTVITGSYNPTTDGSYDNVVVIDSPPLARHYEEQFSQLLEKGKRPSKRTSFLHNGRPLEAYACPQDGCAEALHAYLRSANRSIRFSLFTFTDEVVAEILLRKHDDGVLVTGIVESFQSKRQNQYYALLDAGMDVHLEDTPTLQHNKVFVIDDEVVITGSYNPTLAAGTVNDENIIVFHDPSIALHYRALVEDTIKRTQSFKYGSSLS